jgi:phosphopantothenoylcysteine decarboxylase
MDSVITYWYITLELTLIVQSNVLRAWNPLIPILLAPAMNTQMYTHPITAHHLSMIKAHLPYIKVINPIEKILACGDVGMGGMAEWGDVVGKVVRELHLRIRPESDDEDINSEPEDETQDNEDEGEGEEEDEGIRAGGEEHEDEKRDNVIREREEEEEERQEIVRLATRDRV